MAAYSLTSCRNDITPVRRITACHSAFHVTHRRLYSGEWEVDCTVQILVMRRLMIRSSDKDIYSDTCNMQFYALLIVLRSSLRLSVPTVTPSPGRQYRTAWLRRLCCRMSVDSTDWCKLFFKEIYCTKNSARYTRLQNCPFNQFTIVVIRRSEW
jgi:hypothetical protein